MVSGRVRAGLENEKRDDDVDHDTTNRTVM